LNSFLGQTTATSRIKKSPPIRGQSASTQHKGPAHTHDDVAVLDGLVRTVNEARVDLAEAARASSDRDAHSWSRPPQIFRTALDRLLARRWTT